MNKIFNINLGGYPFTIDEDAYDHLSRYLETIRRHFMQSEGFEEITADIEARMAELFEEALGGRPIVTLKDVNRAIATMGRPEDFGAEPMEEEAPKGKYKTGRRLFRNPEDEIIGGVCSGVAAYFGIEDPVWVRLFFVVFAISFGIGIPIYLVLWAILPKAESASDKLAMRGEPINVSNIGKIIEEELKNFSDKVSELGNELNGKKKSISTGNTTGDALKKGISILGEVLIALIEVVRKIARPTLVIIGLALITALGVIWITSIGGLFFAYPFLHYLFPDHLSLSFIGLLNIIFLIGVPLIGIVLFITRLLFGVKASTHWHLGLWTFWSINLISLVMIGGLFGRQFASEKQVLTDVGLAAQAPDTLVLRSVSLTAGLEARDLFFQDDLLRLEDELLSKEVKLFIQKASGDQASCVVKAISRGENLSEATGLAASIPFELKVDGNILIIPNSFSILKGQKWRNQQIEVFLDIPVGGTIQLEKGIADLLQEFSTPLAKREINPWRYTGKTWQLKEEGFVCLDCETEAETTAQ